MELVADALNNLLHRTAGYFAFLDFVGALVNDFLPLRFGVSVHRVIEAGDKLPGKERPVLYWQGQHFGHFLSSNAHASRISAFTRILASLFAPHWLFSPFSYMCRSQYLNWLTAVECLASMGSSLAEWAGNLPERSTM
jgi:hypothetical protein